METHWEQGEKQKIPFPSSPTRNIKEFLIPHECMLNLFIGWMKLLFPKLFVTIFDLDIVSILYHY
jgi:hypothetical protein